MTRLPIFSGKWSERRRHWRKLSRWTMNWPRRHANHSEVWICHQVRKLLPPNLQRLHPGNILPFRHPYGRKRPRLQNAGTRAEIIAWKTFSRTAFRDMDPVSEISVKGMRATRPARAGHIPARRWKPDQGQGWQKVYRSSKNHLFSQLPLFHIRRFMDTALSNSKNQAIHFYDMRSWVTRHNNTLLSWL